MPPNLSLEALEILLLISIIAFVILVHYIAAKRHTQRYKDLKQDIATLYGIINGIENGYERIFKKIEKELSDLKQCKEIINQNTERIKKIEEYIKSK